MNNPVSQNEPVTVAKRSWWKKRIIPLLTLLFAIIITVGLSIFSHRYPEKVIAFGNYGYLGFFIVSLVSSTTVILPVPGVLVLYPLVATLNPVLLALAGSTGGIIGEITGYMAGLGGRGMTNGGRIQAGMERWMKRWGTWTIFLFAAVPFLPFDAAGIVAGALHYPLWKFLLVGWVGKSLKFIALLYAAAWGWEVILNYLGW